METAIQVFNNPQFGSIRTAGTAEKPMFCLADVCKALDVQSSDVRKRLKDPWVDSIKVGVQTGTKKDGTPSVQNIGMLFVNEQALYYVIMRSDKPQAEPFQDWVCGEVLPTIRKTGGYIAASETMTDEEIMARALEIGQKTIERQKERIRQLEVEGEQQRVAIEQKDATIALQTTELRQSAPKVSYYDQTLQSQNTLTTTQVAKSLGMNVDELTKKLRDAGIIYRQSGQWLLKNPYCKWLLHSTRTSTYTRSDGNAGTSVYTVWTECGRRFIVALHENGYDPKKAVKTIREAQAGQQT